MIATVQMPAERGSAPPKPCIVRWTGSPRMLKVVVQSYCGLETDASVGVMQLPDKVIHTAILCDSCKREFRAYEASLPSST
jgi:hypothetical protein